MAQKMFEIEARFSFHQTLTILHITELGAPTLPLAAAPPLPHKREINLNSLVL
jgi:hypothetical protein